MESRSLRELEASLDRALLAQARRNELTIARVRAIALAQATVLDAVLWWQPAGLHLPNPFSGANALLALAWLVAALALERALARGWYRESLRFVLPLSDGCMLLSLFLCIVLTGGAAHATPALVNVGIGCALLALTGALRLRAAAVWITTAFAVATFAIVAAVAGQPLLRILFSCVLLAGAGFLGMWLNVVVLRAIQAEIGRIVLGRFLPPDVVERAHAASLDALVTPRRLECTVLVSDLRGFTARAESMSPESVLELLDGVQGRLADIVVEHGGRIDKFMGDGMLAVFGMEGEAGHARDALAAAAAMRAAMALFAGAPGGPLRLGVGLHTGPVVAGCLGSGRMEFTVLGDTVNTASRLQDATRQFDVDVLVSATTALAAAQPLRPLGPIELRGRQAALDVYTC